MARGGRATAARGRYVNNRFTAGRTGDDETGMNQSIPERFNRNAGNASHERSVPSQQEHFVSDYYNEARGTRPTTGWQALPEVPTAAEISYPWLNLSELPFRASIREPHGIDAGGGGGNGDDHDDHANEEVEDNDDDEEPYELKTEDTNNIDGPWSSKNRYLQSQYKLLRADALRPLRKAVATVRAAKGMNEDISSSNLGIYDHVHITGFTFANSGIAVRVTFSINRVGKDIKWEQSKRLMTGSLVVLLADDDTAICKVAVVAARPLAMLNGSTEVTKEKSKIDFPEEKDEDESPEIYLFFANSEDLEIDCQREWIMIEERSGFFEAERHTLMALQKMMNESFPLAEHFVSLQTEVYAPDYVVQNPQRNLSRLFSPSMHHFNEVDILNDWPEHPPAELDQSQLSALRRVLTKRLAIVQGPPGTGKTFVSVQALKVLLSDWSHGDPPIILTCQTNHALDQLLRHVQRFMPDIVRLGGRSKDEEIKKRTLFNIRELGRDRTAVTRKALTKDMIELLEPLQKGTDILTVQVLRKCNVITEAQAKSLEDNAKGWSQADLHNQSAEENAVKIWVGNSTEKVNLKNDRRVFDDFEEEYLDFEELKESEAEQLAAEEDLEDVLKGAVIDIRDTFDGSTTNREKWKRQERQMMRNIEHRLQKTPDLSKVPGTNRGDFYRYFLRKVKTFLLEHFRRKAAVYASVAKQRKIDFWDVDVGYLKNQKVIGVTTTGFSKYRGLLSSLKPRIVLIEEAAETLEAPVTATCVESLEHLILVGDHKQLRPHCHSKELEEEPWNLNISLFERLVKNGVEFDMLKRQRRMIPDVSRLLHPVYGPSIENHPSVNDPNRRPPIAGMGDKSTWFFTHDWPEYQDSMRSSFNPLEADMIVHFIQYLMYNGVTARDITVLTFYNGQRRKLRSLLKEQAKNMRDPSIDTDLKVVTVDSYQGEENKIVILSLVRSNRSSKIGFLGVDNRVCVALSRAQCGFYLFGNGGLLYESSETWAAVLDIMAGDGSRQKSRMGTKLPLKCQNHGNEIFIGGPEEWEKNAGGCNVQCGHTMLCGHKCPNLCHPTEHDLMRCVETCGKKLACGHRCVASCGENCRCRQCPETGNASRTSSRSRASPTTQVATLKYHQSPLQTSYPSLSSQNSRPATAWNAYAGGGARKHDATIAQQAENKATNKNPQRQSSDTYVAVAGPSRQHGPKKPSQGSSTSGQPDQWKKFADGGVAEHDAKLAEEATKSAKHVDKEGLAKQRQRLDEENSSLLFSDDPDVVAAVTSGVRTVTLDVGNGRRVWRDRHVGPIGSDEVEDAGGKGDAGPSLLD